jgi:hypothetical protein
MSRTSNWERGQHLGHNGGDGADIAALAIWRDRLGDKAMASKVKQVEAVAYIRTSSAANVGADKDSDKRQRAAIGGLCQAGRVRPGGGVQRCGCGRARTR